MENENTVDREEREVIIILEAGRDPHQGLREAYEQLLPRRRRAVRAAEAADEGEGERRRGAGRKQG